MGKSGSSSSSSPCTARPPYPPPPPSSPSPPQFLVWTFLTLLFLPFLFNKWGVGHRGNYLKRCSHDARRSLTRLQGRRMNHCGGSASPLGCALAATWIRGIILGDRRFIKTVWLTHVWVAGEHVGFLFLLPCPLVAIQHSPVSIDIFDPPCFEKCEDAVIEERFIYCTFRRSLERSEPIIKAIL